MAESVTVTVVAWRVRQVTTEKSFLMTTLYGIVISNVCSCVGLVSILKVCDTQRIEEVGL